jgi:hypothetical protein
MRRKGGARDPDPTKLICHKIKKPQGRASEEKEREQIRPHTKLIPKHMIKTTREHACK